MSKVNLLPFDRSVSEQMNRVEDCNIEEFEGASFGCDRLNVVDQGIERLEESIGGGEAVSEFDRVSGEDGLTIARQTVVLHALDEAEDLGVGVRTVDREAFRDGDTDGGAERTASCLRVGPAKPLGDNLASRLVVQTDQALAEGSLKAILDGFDSLLGPSRVSLSLSALFAEK